MFNDNSIKTMICGVYQCLWHEHSPVACFELAPLCRVCRAGARWHLPARGCAPRGLSAGHSSSLPWGSLGPGCVLGAPTDRVGRSSAQSQGSVPWRKGCVTCPRSRDQEEVPSEHSWDL